MKEIKINLGKELSNVQSFKDYSKDTMYTNTGYHGGKTITYKILINDKSILKEIEKELKR
jgi:hypothetical protein